MYVARLPQLLADCSQYRLVHVIMHVLCTSLFMQSMHMA